MKFFLEKGQLGGGHSLRYREVQVDLTRIGWLASYGENDLWHAVTGQCTTLPILSTDLIPIAEYGELVERWNVSLRHDNGRPTGELCPGPRMPQKNDMEHVFRLKLFPIKEAPSQYVR
jgi:hypothetical protein